MPVASPADRVSFACPKCGHQVSTKAEYAGRPGRCPACKSVIDIPSQDELDESDEEWAPTPFPSIHEPVRRQHQRDNSHWIQTTIAVGTFLLLLLVGYWAATSNSPAGSNVAQALAIAVAAIIIYAPFIAIYPLFYIFSVHKIRRLRHLIYFTLWLGPAVFLAYTTVLAAMWTPNAVVDGIVGLICLGLPWYLIGHWPAFLVTPYILALFVRKLVCPSCHEAHELRSRWACSCGYVDHRSDRHVLLFSCPLCGHRIGNVKCERCETTILV